MKDIAEIRNLPVRERLELVAEIWDTIIEESGELAVPEKLVVELQRRLDEHRSSPQSSRKWSDVRKELFGAN